MTTERWAPVPDFPGYEVSDLGRVRSVDRVITCKDGRTQRWPGRLLTPSPNSRDGRVYVHLAGRTRLLAAVALDSFVGPRPPGMECCHRDDDQSNNRLENLRWDTSTENKLDIVRNGNHELVNRTACPRRHALTEPNLVASKLRVGSRQCLACHRAAGYVAYHPELRPDFLAVADRYFAEIMKGHAA